ncbi:hypothetical protein [Mesorhizobium muleiense]|jgi:hypothetical protein|uniref:hypothetical protein n=1 Tax=Mesorhizobium muleiense TaxID=1004279 RepID=UPI001F47DC12|nr:hypothetical protein [Mesorhizobium muleiense]MCF6111397.1 hypothetical protein [Mesorhizobium muleiense]
MADIGDKGLTACDEMSEFGSKSSTKEEKQPMAGKITALDLAPAESLGESMAVASQPTSH